MDPKELRARRRALDLSQAALAALFGVSDRTISRYERGNMPIPPWMEWAIMGLESKAVS